MWSQVSQLDHIIAMAIIHLSPSVINFQTSLGILSPIVDLKVKRCNQI